MALNDFNQPPNEQSTQAIQLSSTYPLAPISYVNSYSDENVKLGKAPPPPPIIKVNKKFYQKYRLLVYSWSLNLKKILLFNFDPKVVNSLINNFKYQINNKMTSY